MAQARAAVAREAGAAAAEAAAARQRSRMEARQRSRSPRGRAPPANADLFEENRYVKVRGGVQGKSGRRYEGWAKILSVSADERSKSYGTYKVRLIPTPDENMTQLFLRPKRYHHDELLPLDEWEKLMAEEELAKNDRTEKRKDAEYMRAVRSGRDPLQDDNIR